MIKNSILVLDGNQRSSLAVIRSLGKFNDIKVFSADTTTNSLSGCSKYCNAYFQYPSPTLENNYFIEWLINFINKNKISIIIPCTEITSKVILINRSKFNNLNIPFPDINTVMRLSDKAKLISLAKELGITYPTTIFHGDSSELSESLDIKYPIIIKPILSVIWTGECWISSKVYIAHSKQELDIFINTDRYLQKYPFLLQDFIPGIGAGIFALFNQGEPVAYFAHNRIREKPPWGGVSVLSESVNPNPIMKRNAELLLKAVNWHGVAMVEFRISHNGIPYLMEINTRFWGSLQLAIDCGINFPWLLYLISNGIEPDPIFDYEIGQRLRWLMGDFDSLYLALRDKKHISISNKLKYLLDFFIPRPFITRHEINRINDMGPALYEFKEYIKQLSRKT